MYPKGSEVTFQARTGKRFDGIVKGIASSGKLVVLLVDDPFPVELDIHKLMPKEHEMTTKTKRAAAETAAPAKTRTPRKAAAAAATPAKRPGRKPAAETAEKAAPTKRAAKAATPVKKAAASGSRVSKTDPDTWPVPGKNPYRPGSNLAKITDVLLKGGKRSAQVAKLQRAIDMHPYSQNEADLDIEKELDKRLMLTAGLLERNFSFSIEKTGRGIESGTVKVIPPAA